MKNYRKVQVDLSSTRLNVVTLRSEVDAARNALEASKTLVSQAQGDLEIA